MWLWGKSSASASKHDEEQRKMFFGDAGIGE